MQLDGFISNFVSQKIISSKFPWNIIIIQKLVLSPFFGIPVAPFQDNSYSDRVKASKYLIRSISVLSVIKHSNRLKHLLASLNFCTLTSLAKAKIREEITKGTENTKLQRNTSCTKSATPGKQT